MITRRYLVFNQILIKSGVEVVLVHTGKMLSGHLPADIQTNRQKEPSSQISKFINSRLLSLARSQRCFILNHQPMAFLTVL